MNKKLKLFLMGLMLVIFSFSANAQVSFGNANGDVVLIEYFDYNCPVCRHFAPTLFKLTKTRADLHVIERVVPVLTRQSELIDRAVLASFYQNKFKQLQHRVLHSPSPETLSLDEIFQDAKWSGINLETLKKDMFTPLITAQLKENIVRFLNYHENHIPLIVIQDKARTRQKTVLVGTQSISTLKRIIDAYSH